MDNTTCKRLGGDACDPIPHTRSIMDYLNRTAIVEPSRSGGGDHSLKANRAGVDPMIFGGRRFERDALCDPRRSMVTRRIVQLGGWITRRDWSYYAKNLNPRGIEVCTDMVTA